MLFDPICIDPHKILFLHYYWIYICMYVCVWCFIHASDSCHRRHHQSSPQELSPAASSSPSPYDCMNLRWVLKRSSQLIIFLRGNVNFSHRLVKRKSNQKQSIVNQKDIIPSEYVRKSRKKLRKSIENLFSYTYTFVYEAANLKKKMQTLLFYIYMTRSGLLLT